MMVWEQPSEVEQPFALTDIEAILSVYNLLKEQTKDSLTFSKELI